MSHSSSADPLGFLRFVSIELELRRGTWPQIARDSGVPYATLTKLAQGETPNPRHTTVARLVDHFLKTPAGRRIAD